MEGIYITYRDFRRKPFEAEFESANRLYRQVQHRFNPEFQTTFDNCCSNAFFCVHKQTRKVIVLARRCRWRWCPICAHAKTRAVTENVSKWIYEMPEVRLLTVTVKHTESPLDYQLDTIMNAWRRLRRLVAFKAKVTGGIWFLQIKRSNGNTEWHPHIHCLVSGKYFDHDRLVKLWQQVTGDSYIVDIRAVHDRKSVAKYVARYVARPAEISKLPDEELVELDKALKGRRLTGSFGTGRGVKLREVPFYDLKSYDRVASWFTVTLGMKSVSEFKAIYRSFLTDSALPLDVFYLPISEFLYCKPPDPQEFAESIHDRQGALW